MTQLCSKCSHANPPEAIYCYHDGVILGGHSANGGPVQAGSLPFPSQFVFPTGQACRNFDQLAVACQQNWPAAVDLLRQGFLASFLGGIGRADLALAAQEAARFPDQDRGLDQLLEKLPSQVLEAPRLRVEPTEINLGVLSMGSNHTFEVHLANQGMRLLYGSIVSDCKWLTLGDAPGNPQKLFQFGSEGVVHAHVRGQHLRAGNKPLEGHLVVESNGGAATITVRVEVPAKPFPDGVLAGATTPRQIAEKAHAAPKEAAALFEGGAVAHWFGENGWIYPVQGPPASGVGAVQQFFEALGLSKAPKVEVTQSSLSLRGNVGESVQAVLELKAQEKRPVYAHAVADQPWLDVSKTVLSGRTANIIVLVPHIPDRPGDVLQANMTVTANGNQKFVVPVSLTIEGQARPYYAEVVPVEVAPIVEAVAVPTPIYTATPVMPVAVVAEPLEVMAVPAVPVVQAAPAVSVAPVPPPVRLAPPPLPPAPPQPLPPKDNVIAAPPAAVPFVPVPVTPQPNLTQTLAPVAIRVAIHAVPLVVLVFFLLVLLLRDIIWGPAVGEDNIPIDPSPKLGVYFDDTGMDEDLPRLGMQTSTMSWGLVEIPKTKGQMGRKLTYSKYGRTNSTVLKIAGNARARLGHPKDWKMIVRGDKLGEHGGRKTVWLSNDRPDQQIQVTQLVEIVPGEPVEYKSGKLKRYYDTCRVRYQIENKGKEVTSVGLRVMIDTLIGVDESGDGVPFTVPGMKGLVDKDHSANFPSAKLPVPDFIQVLEKDNLRDPGLVAFMNLKLGGGVEPPSRVLLTHWHKGLDDWDIPERPFHKTDLDKDDDSAVVLYWEEKDLRPGEKREVGFSYGLGNLSISSGGRLGISVGGSLVKDSDLTLVTLVNNPKAGEELTLKLPAGLKLVEGDAKQAVPAGGASDQSPVTWRIRAERAGTFTIEVHSSTGVSQKKSITIRTKTIF
jgi:hypothetical protein